MRMRTLDRSVIVAGLAATLAGCNLTGAMDPPPAFPTGTATGSKAPYVPSSEAGLPVSPGADGTKLAKLVVKRDTAGAFGQVRSDPFALTTEEKSFDKQQEVERFFGGASGFSVRFTPKDEVEEDVTPPEPQPYRRLSGIIVGDSILAILEEEGKEPLIVTPGMQIPNSQWRVVSIDQDKLVLRRSGSAKPSQVIVRLETPRFGTAPGGQTGGFPGGPGGGFPGGPGGGFPGGPPRPGGVGVGGGGGGGGGGRGD